MFLALFPILSGCESNEPNDGDTDDSAATDDTSTPPPPALPTHWEALPSMANARRALGCTAIAGDVYAIAGYGFDNDPFRKDVEVLHEKEWSSKAPMSVARDYFITAPRADQSAFAILGGFSKGMENSLLEYDIGGDSWSSIGNLANRVMPVGAAITGDRAVIAAGSYDWTNTTTDTQIIDFGELELADGAPVPEPFLNGASAAVGDKVYVSGGTDGVFSAPKRDDLLVYDAAADTWTSLAPFPGGNIIGHAMVALHDHLFVIGGFDANLDVLDAVWTYDIATNTWSEADPLPGPVAEACAVADGDRIVVVGGSRSYPDPIAEAVAYVP